MLIITGSYKNEAVDKKVVTAKELADRYDLPAKGENNLFKFMPDLCRKDNHGQIRSPRSLGFQPEVVVNIGDDSFTLRYAKSQSNGPNNTIRYTPRQIVLTGNHMFEDYEMFVFCCMNKRVDGPNKGRNQLWYSIYRHEREAANAQRRADLIKDMIDQVNGASQETQLIKAKGMKLSVASWSDAFMGLINLINKDVDQFQELWESSGTTDMGCLVLATERNIIAVGTYAGKQVWQWGPSARPSLSGTLICDISGDPMVALTQHLSDPSNYMAVMPVVKQTLNPQVAPAVLSNEPTVAAKKKVETPQFDIAGAKTLVDRAMATGDVTLLDTEVYIAGVVVTTLEENETTAEEALNRALANLQPGLAAKLKKMTK